MQALIEVNESLPQRDRYGRFAKGNRISKRGGHARAHALSPKRRRQIAKQGWRGLVAKQFGGDERAAKAWWGAIGAWNYDQQLAGLGWYLRGVFPHPGSPTDFRAQLYQTNLFDPLLREPDFYGDVKGGKNHAGIG